MRLRASSLVLIAAVLSGCSALQGSPTMSPELGSPKASTDAHASGEPLITPPPPGPSATPTRSASAPIETQQPTQSIAATAAPTEPNTAALDAFWLQLTGVMCIGFPPVEDDWQSVAEMTSATDLVVLGRPAAVEHRFDSQYDQNVTVIVVSVDRVLHGKLTSRRNGDVEIVRFFDVDPPIHPVTGIEHVLFLDSFAKEERSRDRPVSEDDKYSYYLASPYENVFANVQGNVAIPEYADLISFVDTYPLIAKHGSSFNELVAAVEKVASTTDLRTTRPPLNGALFAC